MNDTGCCTVTQNWKPYMYTTPPVQNILFPMLSDHYVNINPCTEIALHHRDVNYKGVTVRPKAFQSLGLHWNGIFNLWAF